MANLVLGWECGGLDSNESFIEAAEKILLKDLDEGEVEEELERIKDDVIDDDLDHYENMENFGGWLRNYTKTYLLGFSGSDSGGSIGVSYGCDALFEEIEKDYKEMMENKYTQSIIEVWGKPKVIVNDYD